MKRSYKILSVIALSITTSFAWAAGDIIKLEDETPILGKWKLYAEAPALHKEKKTVDIDWDFQKNGVLKTSATDSRATGSMSITVKYSIEDGAIKKQISPGREKYESCNIIEKKDSEMVLKCKYLYYFLKRK